MTSIKSSFPNSEGELKSRLSLSNREQEGESPLGSSVSILAQGREDHSAHGRAEGAERYWTPPRLEVQSNSVQSGAIPQGCCLEAEPEVWIRVQAIFLED